jgi:hypothetical protein
LAVFVLGPGHLLPQRQHDLPLPAQHHVQVVRPLAPPQLHVGVLAGQRLTALQGAGTVRRPMVHQDADTRIGQSLQQSGDGTGDCVSKLRTGPEKQNGQGACLPQSFGWLGGGEDGWWTGNGRFATALGHQLDVSLLSKDHRFTFEGI